MRDWTFCSDGRVYVSGEAAEAEEWRFGKALEIDKSSGDDQE
jgi:hypothetical protein